MAPHRVEGLLAAAGQVAAVRRHLLLCLQEHSHVHGHEPLDGRVTQLAEELSGYPGALLGVEGVVGRSALGYGPVEQAVRGRHGQHVADAERPGGLAADGDPVGVTAESGDVPVYPGQGGHLVQRAVDAAGGEVVAQVAAQVAEAQRTQPVVDGHHDDVAPCGERRAVVPGCCTLAVLVGAAVDPDIDGPQGIVACRGHDVQREAVLVPRDRDPTGEALARKLRGGRAEPAGIPLALPRFVRLGCAESQRADGGSGVTDAGEDLDAPTMPAPQEALLTARHRIRSRLVRVQDRLRVGRIGAFRTHAGRPHAPTTFRMRASPWPPPPQRAAAPMPPPRRFSS